MFGGTLPILNQTGEKLEYLRQIRHLQYIRNPFFVILAARATGGTGTLAKGVVICLTLPLQTFVSRSAPSGHRARTVGRCYLCKGREKIEDKCWERTDVVCCRFHLIVPTYNDDTLKDPKGAQPDKAGRRLAR